MDKFKIPTGIQKSNKGDNLETLEFKLKDDSKIINNFDIVNDQNDQLTKRPTASDCNYVEPKWSLKPDQNIEYKFEVLKSGLIVEEIKNLQSRPFWIFGRFPKNDILMAHPTISRYHAVLQYRPKSEQTCVSPINDKKQDEAKLAKIFEEGWYIYDIGSTHGTFLNKMRIPSRTYIRMKVGHMLKLGASTRNFILQGPNFDEESESLETVTELKYMRKKNEIEKQEKDELQQELREKEGISWGIPEDADEETDLTINPYASTNNEELFLDDPKKTLRGYFEREGLDLEYKCDEMSPGTFICRIELPLTDSNGKLITAEVCHKGKKKECVVQCALEACRILDRHGVLRQANHEPLRKRVKPNNSDDDDDFLDRTGDIARKKLRKESVNQKSSLSYEELIEEEQTILFKKATVEENILKYQKNTKQFKENNSKCGEDLDDFMEKLSEKTLTIDKTEIRRLRLEQQYLTGEHQNLQKLIKLAKPIDILMPIISKTEISDVTKKKLSLPLFGKRNKYKFNVVDSQSKSKIETEKSIDNDVDYAEIKPKSFEDKTPKNQTRTNIESIQIKNKEEPLKDELMNKPNESIDMKIVTSAVEFESDSNKDTFIRNDELLQSTFNAKKRRNRSRIRNKRENIDIDDSVELESAENHSDWVPPINQTGDGITNLNSKFGY